VAYTHPMKPTYLEGEEAQKRFEALGTALFRVDPKALKEHLKKIAASRKSARATEKAQQG
jgi:hypothetical protein